MPWICDVDQIALDDGRQFLRDEEINLEELSRENIRFLLDNNALGHRTYLGAGMMNPQTQSIEGRLTQFDLPGAKVTEIWRGKMVRRDLDKLKANVSGDKKTPNPRRRAPRK